MGHLNLRGGFLRKKKQIENLVRDYDMFAITETKLDEMFDDEVEISGYEYYGLVGQRGAIACGGIIVYYKTSFARKIELKEMGRRAGDIEYTLLKGVYKPAGSRFRKKIDFVFLYRPPKSYVDTMTGFVTRFYRKNSSNHVVIIGDMNVDMRADPDFDILDRGEGLWQVIDKVTRPESQTIIDHIWTNIDDYDIEGHVLRHKPALSDHKVIGCESSHL